MKPLNFVTPTLVLIILAVSFFWWGSCQKNKADRLAAEIEKSNWQQDLKAKTAEILTRDRAIFKKDSLRLSDSLKFRMREKGLQIEIKTQRQTIARLRPLIPTDLLENDTLTAVLEAMDSTIDIQERLIRDQEIFCTAQVKDLREIIQLNEQKFQSQVEISEAWRQQAVESDKKVRKLGRKVTLWKIIGGVAVATTLYITVKSAD